jgi:hypothetical protein
MVWLIAQLLADRPLPNPYDLTDPFFERYFPCRQLLYYFFEGDDVTLLIITDYELFPTEYRIMHFLTSLICGHVTEK